MPRRLRVEREHGDVQRRRVVGDARFGLERRVRAVVRIALLETIDERRGLPDLLGQLTVEADRGGRTDGRRRPRVATDSAGAAIMRDTQEQLLRA